MNIYQKSIIELLNVSEKDAAEIEDYMRHTIFNSTLNWQSKAQFNKGAKEAWGDIQYMRSDEGKAYLKELEMQYA